MSDDADPFKPVSLLWLANELYWRQNLAAPATRSDPTQGGAAGRRAGETPNPASSRPGR